MRTKWSVMAMVGLALVVSACSDDNTVSVGPPQVVEKSTAILTGDAICKQLAIDDKALIDGFKSAHPSPSNAEVLDFFVTSLLPRLERGIGDIHRIGEPTKDRVDYDEAVKALDAGLSQYKTEVQTDAVKALTSKTTAFDKAHRLFDAYGPTADSASSGSIASDAPGQRFTECNKPFV